MVRQGRRSGTTRRTTPTTLYRPVTPFPYAAQTGEKKRPVVLGLGDRVVRDTGINIAVIVTSHTAYDAWGVPILAWQDAGLLVASVVRSPKVLAWTNPSFCAS